MSEDTKRLTVTHCSHIDDKTTYKFSDGSVGTWHTVYLGLNKWGFGPEHNMTEAQMVAARQFHAGKRGEIL